MSFYSINTLTNNSMNACSFNDKQIKETNNIEFYSLVTKLNFFKFTCTQDLDFFKTILVDFNKGLTLIKNNSVDIASDSIYDEYIIDLFALMIASLTYISSSDTRMQISEINFNNYINTLDKAVNKYKTTTINNKDRMLFIGMFMTIETMLDILYSEDFPFQTKLDKYKKTLFTKFPLDFNTINSLRQLFLLTERNL